MAALVLAAVSGWGVSAYAVFSARQQERAYLDQISRVTAERDKGNADLNQMRAEAERNRQTLERAQADLVSVRAQLQASPPPTARDEMRRVTADRDKLNVELTQMRAEAERNRLALERAQAELASARVQPQADLPPTTSQVPLPSPAPTSRTRPRR
jgi:chromosome segregation ATPase